MFHSIISFVDDVIMCWYYEQNAKLLINILLPHPQYTGKIQAHKHICHFFSSKCLKAGDYAFSGKKVGDHYFSFIYEGVEWV